MQPASLGGSSGANALSRYIPGIVLSTIVALSAFAVRDAPLLAPLILALGLSRIGTDQARPGEVGSKPSPLPWFLAVFVIFVIVNTIVPHPASLNAAVNRITTFLFTVSLAAIGLGTKFSDIQSKGVKPIALPLPCFIAILSLVLIRLSEHLGALP